MPRYDLGNHGVGRIQHFKISVVLNVIVTAQVAGDVEDGRQEWHPYGMAGRKRCKVGRSEISSVCIRPSWWVHEGLQKLQDPGS